MKMEKRQLAKAKFDNLADSPDELAFRKGDILTVLDKKISGVTGWWLCSLRGRDGIVPANRLTLLAGLYNDSALGFNSSPESSTDGSFVDYDTPRSYGGPNQNNNMRQRALPKVPTDNIYDVPPNKLAQLSNGGNKVKSTSSLKSNTPSHSPQSSISSPQNIYDQLPCQKPKPVSQTSQSQKPSLTQQPSGDLYDILPPPIPTNHSPSSLTGNDSKRSSIHSTKSSLSSGGKLSDTPADIYDIPRSLNVSPPLCDGVRSHTSRQSDILRDSGVYDNARALSSYRESNASILSDDATYDIPRSNAELKRETSAVETGTDTLVKLQQRIHTASGALLAVVQQERQTGLEEGVQTLQGTVKDFLMFTRQAMGIPVLEQRLTALFAPLAESLSKLSRGQEMMKTIHEIGDMVTRISTLLHANMTLLFSQPSTDSTESGIKLSGNKSSGRTSSSVSHRSINSSPKPTNSPNKASDVAESSQLGSRDHSPENSVLSSDSFNEYDYCDLVDDTANINLNKQAAEISSSTADLQYIVFYLTHMQSSCAKMTMLLDETPSNVNFVQKMTSLVTTAHQLVYMADTLTGKLNDEKLASSISNVAGELCKSLRSLVHSAGRQDNTTKSVENIVRRTAQKLTDTLAGAIHGRVSR